MVQKSRGSVIVCVLVFLLFFSFLAGSGSAEDWPMFLKTPKHIAVTSSLIPDEVEVIWEAELIGDAYSSPVVVDDRVYLGSGYVGGGDEDNYDVFYCFNAETGDELWSFKCAEGSQSDFGLCSTPCVDSGRIYFGTSDFYAYCLDAETGDEIWSIYLIEETHPPANYGTCASPVVYKGNVYFGTDSYEADSNTNQRAPNLYCLDAKGNGEGTTDIIWDYASPDDGFIYSSPAISGDRLVVATWTGTGGEVVCVDTDGNGDGTTTEYWTMSMPSQTQASPVIEGDLVYIGDGAFTSYPSTERITYQIYAIDINSQGELNMYSEEWHYIGINVFESSAVPYNDKLFVGDLSGTVHCIDTDVGFSKTASADWTFETGNEIWGTPAIANGRLVIGNFNGDLFCLDTNDGSEVWNIHLSDTEIYTTAALVDDKIYIATHDNNLFCLGAEGSEKPNSPAELSEGVVTPAEGDEDDEFTFSVLYTDFDDDQPDYVNLYLDGDYFEMSRVTSGPASDYDYDFTNGERYIYETELSADSHRYNFEAFDGSNFINTDSLSITVATSGGSNGDGNDGTDTEDSSDSSNNAGNDTIFMIIIVVISMVIILRKRRQ